MELDKAIGALHEGETLVVTTPDRLGQYTAKILKLAEVITAKGAGLRVLNLGGGNVDTSTPMGAMVFPSWPHPGRWNLTSSVSA